MMEKSRLESKNWQVLGDEQLLDASPWFNFTKETILLPSGNIIDDYYQIKAPSYVEVAPFNLEGEVLMLWRYKHGPRQYTLGFPGGHIKPEEDPFVAAQRELKEECALETNTWCEIGSFTVDGNRGDSKAYFWVADNCVPSEIIESDDLEESQLIWLNLDSVEVAIKDKSIKTLSAYTLALKIIGMKRNA